MTQAPEPKAATQEPEVLKIGELLTQAGVITSGDVVEAIQISRRMGLPIGRVLVMAGVLSEPMLAAALEAQQMLRSNGLLPEQVFEALRVVQQQTITFNEALELLDCKPSLAVPKSKLGMLLVDSELASEEQVEKALAASFNTGIPLGSMLVLQGILSAQLLPGILDAQERLKSGKLSRQDAVQEIKSQFVYWASAQQSKDEFLQCGAYDLAACESITAAAPARLSTQGEDVIPLINLLEMSGFLRATDLQDAIRAALKDARQTSKLVSLLGLVDQRGLESAWQCHALVNANALSVPEAAGVLSEARVTGEDLNKILARHGLHKANLTR